MCFALFSWGKKVKVPEVSVGGWIGGRKSISVEDKCSLMQSIAINSYLIHETIKTARICMLFEQTVRKDCMYTEKCVRHVSFCLNVFVFSSACVKILAFLLTLQEYWLQLLGWRGYGSSYPECWQCLWSGVGHCDLSASSPASAGARRWGSPWVVANGSPAR